MSRRHNASRRRAYGRRQHEVRERMPETATGTGNWRETNDLDEADPAENFPIDLSFPTSGNRFSGAHS